MSDKEKGYEAKKQGVIADVKNHVNNLKAGTRALIGELVTLMANLALYGLSDMIAELEEAVKTYNTYFLQRGEQPIDFGMIKELSAIQMFIDGLSHWNNEVHNQSEKSKAEQQAILAEGSAEIAKELLEKRFAGHVNNTDKINDFLQSLGKLETMMTDHEKIKDQDTIKTFYTQMKDGGGGTVVDAIWNDYIIAQEKEAFSKDGTIEERMKGVKQTIENNKSFEVVAKASLEDTLLKTPGKLSSEEQAFEICDRANPLKNKSAQQTQSATSPSLSDKELSDVVSALRVNSATQKAPVQQEGASAKFAVDRASTTGNRAKKILDEKTVAQNHPNSMGRG